MSNVDMYTLGDASGALPALAIPAWLATPPSWVLPALGGWAFGQLQALGSDGGDILRHLHQRREMSHGPPRILSPGHGKPLAVTPAGLKLGVPGVARPTPLPPSNATGRGGGGGGGHHYNWGGGGGGGDDGDGDEAGYYRGFHDGGFHGGFHGGFDRFHHGALDWRHHGLGGGLPLPPEGGRPLPPNGGLGLAPDGRPLPPDGAGYHGRGGRGGRRHHHHHHYGMGPQDQDPGADGGDAAGYRGGGRPGGFRGGRGGWGGVPRRFFGGGGIYAPYGYGGGLPYEGYDFSAMQTPVVVEASPAPDAPALPAGASTPDVAAPDAADAASGWLVPAFGGFVANQAVHWAARWWDGRHKAVPVRMPDGTSGRLHLWGLRRPHEPWRGYRYWEGPRSEWHPLRWTATTFASWNPATRRQAQRLVQLVRAHDPRGAQAVKILNAQVVGGGPQASRAQTILDVVRRMAGI